MYLTRLQSYIIKISGPMCGDLAEPSNATVVTNGMHYEDEEFNVTCDTGFVLIGSGHRVCQSDGKWSGKEATCERMYSWC